MDKWSDEDAMQVFIIVMARLKKYGVDAAGQIGCLTTWAAFVYKMFYAEQGRTADKDKFEQMIEGVVDSSWAAADRGYKEMETLLNEYVEKLQRTEDSN